MLTKTLRIALVGGIAVGKSTIIKSLYQKIDDCILIEENVKQNVFLSDFYEDMTKWAFHSRISTIAMLADSYLQASNNLPPRVILMDRCIDESIIFAQLQYDKNNLSDKEFLVYKTLYNSMIKLSPPIDLFIYVNCNVKISMERIRKRNRPFEKGITDGYLETINEYYNKWIRSLNPQKVVSLNTDQQIPVGEVLKIVQDLIEKIPDVSC